MENDTVTGGEAGLSLDEAAKAYVSATTPPAVKTDQAEGDKTLTEDSPADDELQAEDIPAGEEAEDESGDEDQAEEDEEGDEPESEKGRFVGDNARVKLADGSIVSIADLKKGSLLNADYTRKTQEVAEQRKQFEAQSERIKQQEQKVTEQGAYVADLIRSIVPKPPDPALLNTDPVGYMQQEAQFKQWTAHLNFLDQQKQRTEQERQAETASKEKETADREWNALLTKMPELKDEKRLNALASDMKTFGQTYGFSPEEIARVPLDSRQAVVLAKAIKWDKLQANKAKIAPKVENRPPVSKGGKRSSPDAARARTASAALDNLKQSGRIDDAVAAYLATNRKG